MTKLVYNSAWEMLFEGDKEKIKDYEELSKLAMKYEKDVQLFFGTREELHYLKELKLQEMERNGVEVIRD